MICHEEEAPGMSFSTVPYTPLGRTGRRQLPMHLEMPRLPLTISGCPCVDPTGRKGKGFTELPKLYRELRNCGRRCLGRLALWLFTLDVQMPSALWTDLKE